MNILAHRGFWQSVEEKNSILATTRAIECGFGIELDVRDQNGSLVVSHDIPKGSCAYFKEHMNLSSDKTTWAINIKADGLASVLKSELEQFGIENYFAFDMSIPEIGIY